LQFNIPCSVYRGGTSRGLFFHRDDLPIDDQKTREIFLSGIDAYNPSQVDGLGSGTSHTSKIVVISPSTRPNIDIEYTFYQIGIGNDVVDDKGTCGNLMAAVGAFAIDENLVQYSSSTKHVNVSVYNTNVDIKVDINVPVTNKGAEVKGNYLMPGLKRPGSRYIVKILDPGGGKLGTTFPLESVYTLNVEDEEYKISALDVVNPFVHVSSQSIGLSGTEMISDIKDDRYLLDKLDAIRNQTTMALGLAKTIDEAKYKSPAIPKITMVAEPKDYMTTSGEMVRKEDVDIIAKMISMGNVHRTFAASGLYNLAAATLLPGTIPNQLSGTKWTGNERIIRIGHPEGVAKVRVSLTSNGDDVAYVGMDRTARKIIKGKLYIPE